MAELSLNNFNYGAAVDFFTVIFSIMLITVILLLSSLNG